jgi:histidinol-phosphate aminotransferase
MEKKFHPPSERKDKIKLDLNENLMGCSLKVIEALKKITCNDVAVYPEYDEFMNKLGSYLDVSVDNVLLTNGADDAIKAVMDTYLEKDDEIIIPVPTFYMFENYASIIGADKKLVEFNEDLSFPAEKIIESITPNTKMIVIVNPNNPTGTIVEDDDILRVIQAANDAVVVIDEAYYQFSKKSSKDLISIYDNVLVIQTFSKGFGLAGVRLGYIISNPKIVNEIKKVVLPFSVNGLTIVAASAALDDLDFVDHYVSIVKENRDYILNELGDIGVKTYPSDANFIIANFGENSSLILQKLNEKNILVKDVSNNPLLDGCLRIAIGTKEQMETLVNEIKTIFELQT